MMENWASLWEGAKLKSEYIRLQHAKTQSATTI